MCKSINDLCVLHRSSLYHKAKHNTFWDATNSFEGFSLYLLINSRYPFLPWLIVPHKGHGNMPIADLLFNKKLRRGCGVVENAFGIRKLMFWELLVKSKLQVTFLPDVIICCTILHNMLLQQSHKDVERLFQVLCTNELDENSTDYAIGLVEAVEGV